MDSSDGQSSTSQDSVLSSLEAAALAGGAVLRREFFARSFETNSKTSHSDLVTSADHAVTAAVVPLVERLMPDVVMVAEEAAGPGSAPCGDNRVYIDPIDGTLNFVHGFPEVCVSLGYWEAGEPVIGVVYNPVRDQLFSGMRSRGAFLNGQPIHTASAERLEEGLVGTGWPYDHSLLGTALSDLGSVVGKVREVRTIGSAALGVCYVASGVFDAFWEHSLSPWDLAGAAVIALESGALVTRPDGSPFDLFRGDVLVANPAIHSLMAQRLCP
jgi:myo-inositol-1(or 4)-monophosphatase